MKNRILSLLLALVLVLSMVFVMVSCGPAQDTPPDDDKTNQDDDDKKQPDDDDDTPTTNYPWKNTNIFFQLSDNSHGKELSSGAKRYLAGETRDNETIDQSIAERNGQAVIDCKVTVTYDYWPDEKGYGWGENIDQIYSRVSSGASTAPDMYSVFVYDMVGALLRGCFANILSQSRGENYFRFVEDDYDYSDAANIPADADDEGYMYEYMSSLTLSSKKMYLVASDYFTDLVRAFFVVPVNIKLLTERGTSVTGDADGDGDVGTYLDLVHIVRERGWNYELLKAYCDEVKSENTEGKVTFEGEEGIVGFAVSSASGLSSSGLLYTTPITIIERNGNDLSDYIYSYPDTNEQLTKFCVALANLMSSEGALAYGANGANGSLDDIRVAFANNKVLFGGVICVGSLEDEVYQRMRGDGGFGVLPVPIYADTYVNLKGETKNVEYLTQIHNLGRIGGISASSSKFSQCSAFLNYLSTHSTEILDEYYNWKLAIGVVGGTNAAGANEEMLHYIREHVRSAFDKVFEDALGIFGNFGNDLYHKIIQNGRSSAGDVSTPAFQIGENMTGIYAALHSQRQEALGTYNEYGEPQSGLILAFNNGTFGD